MSRYRIKGGERIATSGKKWSEDELKEVLALYVNYPELKIHESNKQLQILGSMLGRTTRSVEAQLLMFRNLDKFGMSGYKNMSKLCKKLWKEYIEYQISNNGIL